MKIILVGCDLWYSIKIIVRRYIHQKAGCRFDSVNIAMHAALHFARFFIYLFYRANGSHFENFLNSCSRTGAYYKNKNMKNSLKFEGTVSGIESHIL